MCLFLRQHTKLCLFCLVLHALTWQSHVHSKDHHGNHASSSQTTSDIGHLSEHDGSTQYSKLTNSSVDHQHHHHHDHEIAQSNATDQHVKAKNKFSVWSKKYVNRLFEKYGSDGLLKIDELIVIFENLGFDPNLLPDHLHQNSHFSNSKSHVHSNDLELNGHHHDDDIPTSHKQNDEASQNSSRNKPSKKSNVQPPEKIQNSHKRKTRDVDQEPHQHDHEESHEDHLECDEFYERFDINKDSNTFTEEQFVQICPGIVYTLSERKCSPSAQKQSHENSHSHAKSISDIPPKVWGYAILSILMISLVGLLGVAVIPIMQKVFYNHLLQFLVAVAVGALTGDALLHLLPHALQGGHHDHVEGGSHSDEENRMHRSSVLKGLCGLLGIFFFFFMERVLSIITDMKRKRKKSHTVVKDFDSTSEREISLPLTPRCAQMRSTDSDCRDQIMGIHPGQKALTNYAETSQKRCSERHTEDNKTLTDDEDPASVLSHTHHGHSHNLPNSISAIAWMVILGDGIHNFSDGLAIGAAYANSMTGGISTTIAVFCHELPHEIGDFAVLLRAGMSAKQAIMYNCVSSFLAFLGVLFGVAIGNIGEASLWIFVCIAGMFLYIALVDMLPELMSVDTKKGEHPFWHLVLQMFGMLLGASIMFVIAWFERRLQTALD